MTEQEFEKLIKKSMRIKASPNRASFSRLLFGLKENVTKENEIRYVKETAMSKVIININGKFTEFINIWRSKRMLLVPSLVILLVIAYAFSLSPRTAKNKLNIEQIAEQDAQTEKVVVGTDEQTVSTLFDTSDIETLGINKDAI